jgi:hypothetical protein
MKKWQKSWLALLASSLAIGWIVQGEATVIRLGDNVAMTQAQPVRVIIIDSNGNKFEQTANYDPAIGGIDIDTSWAGKHASIFIPSLGVGLIWYNGNWVDEQGYYWNGRQRVAVPDLPQWRKHWGHYWQGRRSGNGQSHGEGGWQGRGSEGWQGHGESWQGHGGEGWQGRGDEGWGDQTNTSGTMRSSGYQSGASRNPSSGGFGGGQTETMRSTGYQGGQSNSGMSGNSRY